MAFGKNYQSLILIVVGVAALGFLLHSVVRNSAFAGFFAPASGAKQAFFGQVAVDVEIASTPSAREKGLSGRQSVPAGD